MKKSNISGFLLIPTLPIYLRHEEFTDKHYKDSIVIVFFPGGSEVFLILMSLKSDCFSGLIAKTLSREKPAQLRSSGTFSKT